MNCCMNAPRDSNIDDHPIAEKQNPVDFDIRTEEIYFADQSNGYYCVCFVDMVDSTHITAQMVTRSKSIMKYSLMPWQHWQRTLVPK
jgi:hypothetical protein